jgi:hypothetical protein
MFDSVWNSLKFDLFVYIELLSFFRFFLSYNTFENLNESHRNQTVSFTHVIQYGVKAINQISTVPLTPVFI